MFDPRSIPESLRSSGLAVAARIEDAGLTASQPSQQMFYDGWLLRYSPGKAKRARSVNAIAAGDLPLGEKIDYCRSFYARVSLPCIFRITPFSLPHSLDEALADAGFAAVQETRVMQLPLPDEDPASIRRESLVALDAANFGDLLGELSGLDAGKRAAERERFARSGLNAAYFAVQDNDRAVACGSVAIEGSLAGIFGMVTAPSHRGRGLASRIVLALLAAARNAGARTAYLQVDAANEPARHLYSKLGFRDCYAYWYRFAPEAVETP
jgi:ribosomal protein S18 acetylase RimI-like enzyme